MVILQVTCSVTEKMGRACWGSTLKFCYTFCHENACFIMGMILEWPWYRGSMECAGDRFSRREVLGACRVIASSACGHSEVSEEQEAMEILIELIE